MDPIVIPIAGIMLPMVLVPSIIAMKHAHRRREWEHAERMKALEMGLPLPGKEGWSALVCTSIGAGVPIAALIAALIGSQGHESEAAWAAAGMVGLGGVISGSTLATRLFPSRRRTKEVDLHAKPPEFDPDAYDVVGRRG
jgi:hypothetical protein